MGKYDPDFPGTLKSAWDLRLKKHPQLVHARVGDLWWYSAMIFLACRSGDAIQAFIGLWLVPKYHITDEKNDFI